MNLCIFVGRLTKDPEMRVSEATQMPIARFTLAVDRGVKREGEETADFFRCVAFDKRAEFVEQYLHCGMRVAIHGKVRTENYTNNSGEKVYGVSILTDNIEFADGKKEGQENHGAGNQQTGIPASQANTAQPPARQASKPAARPATRSTGNGAAGARSQSASPQSPGRGAQPPRQVSGPGTNTSQRQTTQRTATQRAAAYSPARTGQSSFSGVNGVEDDGLPFK